MKPLQTQSGSAGWRCLAAFAALLAAVPPAQTEEPPVFALTNARIVTVSGIAIAKGTIILRNGIIEAVGSNISIPGDARQLDATGLTVYPGLIDALSDAGVEETRSQATAATRTAATPSLQVQQPQVPQQTQQSAPAASPSERQTLSPYVQAADILNPSSRKIESMRAAGITTALVAPTRGIFPGQSALVNLAGSNAGSMVLKSPVALHISLQSGGGFRNDYPGSLMGMFAYVKQAFLDAQHYENAWTIYEAYPGARRPEYSRSLQALQPALKRRLPVVLPARTPAEVQRALDMAASFNLNLILSGAADTGKIAPVLKEKQIPVLLSLKFPERDAEGDPEQEETLEVLRARVEAPATAAALAKAGVRFAFQSGDMTNPRDFIQNAAKTIEAGLDRDIALRALTLTPAEIFGVADRVGSIDKGKTANLVVTTGDIFDPRSRVRYVFVDGQKFDIPEPERIPRPADATATGPASVSGNWILKVESPQGPVELTLKLIQSGRSLTGKLDSPHGVAELSEGEITGPSVKFKATLNQPEGNLVAWFSGTIQGDSITGSIDAGALGKMPFTGSRIP
jgi:imidazolonepropionase-like amidohydrolase